MFQAHLYIVLACLLLPAISIADSEALFAQHCAACHGPEGQGAAGIPDLTDTAWQYGGSSEDIERSITYGRQSIMPALGTPLGAEGLSQVVGYVRSLSVPVDIPDDELAAGAALFTMFCASCHGEQGNGTPALGAPDLTDTIWLYGGDTSTLTDVIANGRANEMPGFDTELSADEIAALSRYIKNLDKETLNRTAE